MPKREKKGTRVRGTPMGLITASNIARIGQSLRHTAPLLHMASGELLANSAMKPAYTQWLETNMPVLRAIRALPQVRHITAHPAYAGIKALGPVGGWIQALPDAMRESLPVMAEHGWYMDGGMKASLPHRFRRLVLEGSLAAAQALMLGHFGARLADIEDELCAQFPERAHILRSAFDAHARGAYVLSVPVFFSQVDGVCHDHLDGGAFFITHGRARLEEHLKTLALGDFTLALLEPFSAPLPVFMSAGARKRKAEAEPATGPAPLNRHQVLHGESVDYGTKANGLRAISLLTYVAQRLDRDDANAQDLVEGSVDVGANTDEA